MNTPAPKPNRPSPPGSKTPWNPTCPSHTPATSDNATGEPFPDTTATAPGTQGICYIAWRITTSTNMPYTDVVTDPIRRRRLPLRPHRPSSTGDFKKHSHLGNPRLHPVPDR